MSRRIARLIGPWVLFWIFLLQGWQVRDLFHNIPGYGDVLEVLWGTQWYHDALFVKHISPLFTPLVFYPNGWHPATLAHTPFFFLLSLPLYEFGGLAFAYNCLALLPLFIAFAGSYRFVRLFTSNFAAAIAAVVFTFIGMRWLRVGGGHLHILWASSLLPWLVWGLEELRRSSVERPSHKWIIFCGIIWGTMINFSLYSIFLGGLAFVIWGRDLFKLKRVIQASAISAIAVILGALTIIPYFSGVQQDQIASFGISHVLSWGASLNSLEIPFIYHPLDWVRQIARFMYSGLGDESGVANLGLLTFILAGLGLVVALRKGNPQRHLLLLTSVGLTLSLGLLLKWNSEVVSNPVFRSLDTFIWNIGHTLKPGLFDVPKPSSPFDDGFPLPGLVLTALVPFWESGRVMSRYALVGGLGLITLGAIGLQRLPKPACYVLAVLWLIEVLPGPTGNYPLPLQPHPAFEWLAKEAKSQEGIVDIVYPTLYIGGETLWATQLHHMPTASGVGSFWPQHTFFLWEYFLFDKNTLSTPSTALVLRQFGIRYILLHHRGNLEDSMWEMIGKNPSLDQIKCFDPPPEPSPWAYPICVARVKDPVLPFNVTREGGWSQEESWGVWAEGTESHVRWIATSRADYHLRLSVFPQCVSGADQSIWLEIKGVELVSHQWQDCETWSTSVLIPASLTQIGWNEITFHYGYAVEPFVTTGGANTDMRTLSVGFTELEVDP